MTAVVCAGTPAAARAVSIEIGSATGGAGGDVAVDVTLHTLGAMVIATENRIDFGFETPIAAADDGSPDCAVNPRIHKAATGFAFLPIGCDPTSDCVSVRTLVVAFDNFTAIPDGSVLYTCRIAIPADTAPGDYPLHSGEANASSVDNAMLPTTGSDGSVEVTGPPVVSVDAGTITVAAGATAAFPVTVHLLSSPPPDVLAVENDVSFDTRTPVAAGSDGTPACSVNPAIGKPTTGFSYLPVGCIPGGTCSGVRAVVFSATTMRALADGETLYTCEVAVAPNVPVGSYPLAVTGAQASGPLGVALPAQTNDGAVLVTAPAPPPCAGDCNDDQTVSIDELLLGVDIVTQNAPLSSCTRLDANQDGIVTIDELVGAVNNALNGCPR